MTEHGSVADDRSAAFGGAHGENSGRASLAEATPAGYGALLARQRQSAGLGVTDVAATLRLHPNQVRAIEQEDLARLPAPAYVRGFIRGYARVVKLDPAPLLSDLNAKLAPAGDSVVDALATDYSTARAAGRERMFPQSVFWIALLVLSALGIVGWQATQRPPRVAAPPPEIAAAQAAPAVPVPAPVQVVDSVVIPAANSAAPLAAADPVPAPADVAEPTVAPTVAAGGAAPTLLLRFNGASWAEVTDRGGKILLSQLSSAGAEHALDGELPLTVVIGDANFASVEVRGAAFSLQPFTRNNVARFTVR